ncbi:hypothetical protein B296_00056267, partial [Ensete ventricosum]
FTRGADEIGVPYSALRCLVTDAALKPDPSRPDGNKAANRFEAHCLPQISLLLLSAPLREGRERSQVCLFQSFPKPRKITAEMAAILKVLVAVLVLVLATVVPSSQAQAPAPSPTSDGTSIDQGIAYLLMLVALVLTYLIHPLDAYSPYKLF